VKLKREAQKTPTIFPFAPIPIEPIFPTAAVPKFALNTYVSIIPDTSLRGYLCNKIIGKIISVNRSEDGIYLYDVHKVVNGFSYVLK